MVAIPLNPYEHVRMPQQDYLELYKKAEQADLLEAIREAQAQMIRKLQDENLKMKKELNDPICQLARESEERILDCGNPDCPTCNPRVVIGIDPAGSSKDATASIVFDKDLLPFIVVKVDDTSGIEMQSLISELKKWASDPTTKIKEVKKSTSPASQSISGSSNQKVSTWTCEYCYTQSTGVFLPLNWGMVWGSCVCPACMERGVKNIAGWLFTVNGGAFSGGKPDPREKTTKPVRVPPKAIFQVRPLNNVRSLFSSCLYEVYAHLTGLADYAGGEGYLIRHDGELQVYSIECFENERIPIS